MSHETPPADVVVQDNVTDPVTAKRRRVAFRLERFATLAFFLVFFIVIGVLKGSQFVSWSNITLVLSQNSYAAVLAAAVTLPLISGQFDLSAGAVAGMSAVLCAYLVSMQSFNTIVAIAIALVVGAAIGVVNGMLVTRGKISSFIVTLGVGGAVGGVAEWISGGKTLFGGIPVGLTKAGTVKVGSIPLPIFYVIVILLILWALTRRTVAGRYWYATGANPESARLAGIKTSKMVVWAFVGSGFIAAGGGVLYLAIFASADPTTGPDLLLPAFAAAFLGSSILSDGKFTIIGSVLGTFLLAYATNGLQIAGVNFAAQPIFTAIVLIGAVGLTELLRRRRQASRPRNANT
jgi:ribose transport system permease protein